MNSIARKLIKAKEENKLIELSVVGKEYPVNGKIIKLDVKGQLVDIERFGAVTRLSFNNVIKVAPYVWTRKSNMRGSERDIFTKGVLEAIDRVLEHYEKHWGKPDENSAVDCPMCEQPTTSYFCAWDSNKHVHFHCKKCKFGFVQ